MKKPFVLKMLQLMVALGTIGILGCEPAPVETGTATTSTSNPSSDGYNPNGTPPNGNQPNGNTNYKTIAVDPPSGVQTSIGVTILKITPTAGYTYQWDVSNTTLGYLSETAGSEVRYIAKNMPSSEPEVQVITVIGINPSSTVKYRGTSTITHQAN